VAPAAPSPAGRRGTLRGDPPLTERPERPFEVHPDRLYDVGPRGGAWTEAPPPSGHQRRLRWTFALALAVNALTWTAAALAFVAGGRGWGAAAGLLAIATAPLLVLPGLIELRARLRARRLHRARPEHFPRA
jgi:hypothetical protein